MAMFEIHCVDEQIKALPTVSTASGSVATFTTDKTENLVEVECEIVYSQASGIPSPSNPLPITTYTSLNLSHSGSDTNNPTITNIAFGQTVAKGKLNVTTGVLEITHGFVDMGNLTWNYRSANTIFYTDLISNCKLDNQSCACSYYEYDSDANDSTVAKIAQNLSNLQMACFTNQERFVVKDTNYTDVPTFTSAVSGQTLVYELATPTTIQLSAQTITALLNENNIWCDTNGNTSVKYILSVGKAVNV